ncbi:hypothetical protein BDY24DRAFT_257811 [Mrakia frigida]|uniref:uncharacterized protein n=1 Tax=Mrakia frigida TaxID=29902 RepID=UPI003FCC0FE2
MGFLSKKKSSPHLANGSSSSSSSSSPSRPPPLPSSKSFSPSSSRLPPTGSRYTSSPSLSSLAAQDRGGGLDAPLKIHERFASRSSSYEEVGSSRSNTPTTDFSRGVADPRMGGGSLRGGGAGIGRDEEAALLAARKRRMASEGSMRSGRLNEGEGGGAEHLRGRFKSEVSLVYPEVKVIQTRKRRATESKGSSAEETTSSPSPSTSRTRPVLKSTTGSTSSSYVLPISIPRPPTPPPPSPEKITFSRSNSSNPPPPALDRSISSPANPRDSVITFNSSSSSLLHSSDYRTNSPPPLPQVSYLPSSAPESTSDARKAAHDIVLRRGVSAHSTSSSSATPPFSPSLAPTLNNPLLSTPSSLDPLLSSAGPVRRKKWDPLAAFGAGGGGGTSPGATSSPSTGLALLGMEASKSSVRAEGSSSTKERNGGAGDQWSPPNRDAPAAPSDASRREAPLISKSRTSSSSGGSHEAYEPWSRSQEDHSSQRTGIAAPSAHPPPPPQLPSMPVAVQTSQPARPPPQSSFSIQTTPPIPHSILKKKSRSDSSSTQSSLPDNLPPPPPSHPRELTSSSTPSNSTSNTKYSQAYPISPPESESTSFEARASRSGSGSGIVPSPISIPASKTKEKFVALNSPIAPYLQHVPKESSSPPQHLESQVSGASSRTTREAKRMASPPSATPLGFTAGERRLEEEGTEGLGLVKMEEKTGQKILRRMGSFGFGRGGVEVDASLVSSFGNPPGSPTTSTPKVQPVTTPFFRGSEANESHDTPPSPISYFSTFSPTPTPPQGQPSSLPSQEENIDPFEKGAPRSPTIKASKKNVTVSLLRSNGKEVEPKGPNKVRFFFSQTSYLSTRSGRESSEETQLTLWPRVVFSFLLSFSCSPGFAVNHRTYLFLSPVHQSSSFSQRSPSISSTFSQTLAFVVSQTLNNRTSFVPTFTSDLFLHRSPPSTPSSPPLIYDAS